MSANAVFTSELPTDADLYVGEFTEAVWNREGTGINFNGAVIKDHDGKQIASGNLFLFDSVLKDRSGNMQPISEVFMLTARWADKQQKHFWNYEPIHDRPIVHVGDAPPMKERSGGGGGGKGRSNSPTRTRDQIDADHERALTKVLTMLASHDYDLQKLPMEAIAAMSATRFIAYGDAAHETVQGRPEGQTQESKPEPKRHPDDEPKLAPDDDIPF